MQIIKDAKGNKCLCSLTYHTIEIRSWEMPNPLILTLVSPKVSFQIGERINIGPDKYEVKLIKSDLLEGLQVIYVD